MDVTFTFTLPDDADELHHFQRGREYHSALEEIANEIFRAPRKHGFRDPALRGSLERTTGGEDLVFALEGKFYDILAQHGVKL